jgi:hypothetical protein
VSRRGPARIVKAIRVSEEGWAAIEAEAAIEAANNGGKANPSETARLLWVEAIAARQESRRR